MPELEGNAMAPEPRTIIRAVWRLEFNSSMPAKWFDNSRNVRPREEIIVYPADTSGPHPYLHFVDFDALGDARHAYRVVRRAKCAKIAMHLVVENSTVYGPEAVDPEWLATNGAAGTAPQLLAQAEGAASWGT